MTTEIKLSAGYILLWDLHLATEGIKDIIAFRNYAKANKFYLREIEALNLLIYILYKLNQHIERTTLYHHLKLANQYTHCSRNENQTV